MQPPIDESDSRRPPDGIHSVGRPFHLVDNLSLLTSAEEGESSFGPLKPHELEFYAKLGDMSPRPIDDDEWAPTAEELADGEPEPDDPDARESGAVWTGRYWRPRGRRRDPLPRALLCPSDFVQMEITTVGWVCPDCGLVKL